MSECNPEVPTSKSLFQQLIGGLYGGIESTLRFFDTHGKFIVSLEAPVIFHSVVTPILEETKQESQ